MVAFCKIRWVSSSFTTLSSAPLRVCIVGSGPAGFYTAEKILKAHETVVVDIIDRLPTPSGLVRSGVAPDHPETKIVTSQFTRVAENDRCSFIGNVSLGSSLTLPELREIYDAGNVALDVARILLRPTEELAKTDLASHAMAALQESSIRKVYLVGRHGPVQAACTAKELREILGKQSAISLCKIVFQCFAGIKGLHIHIQQADLVTTPADEKRRITGSGGGCTKCSPRQPTTRVQDPVPSQHELHFNFFRKPNRFLETDEGLASGSEYITY